MNKKIIRTALALLFVSLLITAPRAQQPAPVAAKQSAEDRIALYQALLDLTNPWTVMCIAAHPDDEDGTSLIVMRRKYGAHTVSLFSTFGEGGQNAIGPELYEEMGAIRARETMAAAEIQGSEPHFLGLKDFGYSKSADEAFKFWGHDEALRRMVLEIRKLRPDVIITNHSATSNDHGHHQATARLELEAFDAAADPKRFPEQLETAELLTPWQVQRLFVRQRGNQAVQNPDRQGGGSDFVTIDPNERDPIRGTMFAEQALAALQKHATQGPWPKTFAEFTARFRSFSSQSGTTGQMPPIRYRLEREAKGANALPGDSHNFLDGLTLPKDVAERVKVPTIAGKPLYDSVDRRKELTALLDTEWKRLAEYSVKAIYGMEKFHDRVNLYLGHIYQAIIIANGISLQLVGPDLLVPGQDANFAFVISNNGPTRVRVGAPGSPSTESDEGISLNPWLEIPPNAVIPPGNSKKFELKCQVPSDIQVTVPHSAHLYKKDYYGELATVSVEMKIGGSFNFLVGTSKILDVAPPVEIKSAQPSLLVLTPQTESRPPSLRVTVVSHLNQPPNLWVGAFGNAPGNPPMSLVEYGRPSLASGESVDIPMNARLRIQNFSNVEISAAIEKDKTSSVVAKATLPIIRADARVVPALRVGYVRGFDFSLPNALAALGVESKELSVDEVKTADLSKYTSIIVDNRVYESQPELIATNQKLLDYANAGGTLIVFYHKSDEWNPDERRKRPQLAPYKLILGNERITDETAPISFIEPEHPLLNSPNKLGPEDFKDWIQERGLYYPREWDSQFHALLQSNDPGEAPLKGGLLVADYGRGHYIYTSMVWYRELRAGVPGAYRMLANMISYGKTK